MNNTSTVLNNNILSVEVDQDRLQKLQDDFSEACNLYTICVGKNKGELTRFKSTSTAEDDFLSQHFTAMLKEELVNSFIDGVSDNVISRSGAEAYIQYRAVAIRNRENRFMGAWLIIAVDQDKIPEDIYIHGNIKRTTIDQLDKSTALLETLCRCYFDEVLKTAEIDANLREARALEKDMEHRLSKSEVLTDILKMMENDGAFATIAEDILRESSRYINAEHGILMQLSNGVCEIVAEYKRDSLDSLIDKFEGLSALEIPFMTGRPYTISSDTKIPKEFSDFFDDRGIRAGIYLPIDLGDRPNMYLCYISIMNDRKWTVDDLKFANDIKRIFGAILIRRITKNSLASSYSALEAILEHVGCGVIVNDILTSEVLYTNESYNYMFSDASDAAVVNDIIINSLEDSPGVFGHLAANSGKYYNLTFSNISWVDGREVRLTTFYDITDIKNYQLKIEAQANEDYLTGLYNRKRCENDLEAEIRATIKSDSKCAMILFDLDDFNNINDALGHGAGDKLLIAVSNAINNIQRLRGHCYRSGGDEFIIIVEHENFASLETIIDKIYSLFDSPWQIGMEEYYCTMSMGVVIIPKDGTTVELLMQRADIALREAKNKGKNRVEYYNDMDEHVVSKRLDLEMALRKAVAEGCEEFEVYYQPLINANKNSNSCCGAEALVRWNSSTMGFVLPSDFIPLAEYLGLIVPIGEHVLKEATKRCKYWNDFGHPEYKVNVNLSVVQLLQNNIIDVIKEAIEESGIDPSNLTLEVTESLAINDLDKMRDVLDGIRSLGARVALDDFGTGYSSLNHIRSMPIDTIKIDQCFIKDMEDDDFSGTFVKTVSQLADSLDMDVCVEGVERSKQEQMLRDMSVDLIQGYYFDKPLSVDEFENKYLM